METDESPLEAVATRLVPVGLGALTWLVVALLAGVALSMGSPSVASVIMLGALAVLFLPVYRARPWESGVTDRVLAWGRRHSRALAVAAGLLVFVRLPVVADVLAPLIDLLLLPVRSVPVLIYDVRLLYGDAFGDAAGRLVYALGRYYVEVLWLSLVGLGVEKLFPPEDEP